MVLLLSGFIIVPQLIIFLGYFKEYTIAAPGLFLDELEFMKNVKMIFTDTEFRKVWLYFQPAVALLIFLLFWNDRFINGKKKRISDFGTPEVAGAGEYGTSRWRNEQEIENTTTVWNLKRKLKDNEVYVEPPMVLANPFSKKRSERRKLKVGGGNVIGCDLKKNKVFLDTQDTNTLIIGTSRSGKTRTFLYPTIWTLGKAGESMIITDPKGEIHEQTAIYLKEHGYDVILLDFRDGTRGNHWNVLHPVIKAVNEKDFAKASEAANDIAYAIVHQQERRGDPLWSNGEASVIAATILAIATSDIPDEQKNMYNVYLNIIELGQPVEDLEGQEIVPLNEYFETLPAGHIAKSAFGTAKLSPAKMRGSFFSSAAASLRLFADPTLAFMTSVQDHNMKNIGREKTAVFMCIPDEKATKHVLASMYVNQVYMELVEEANNNGGRLPVRVNMLLDEFGNMPAVPDFDTKVTVSLGRGIRWTPIVQDLQQLKKRYGDNATTITGNCHTWLYLLTTDEKTADIISKKTGKYTIETQGRSASVNDKGSSRGTSEGLTGRPLLTPDEVLRWPIENALVFQARLHPAHLPLPDFTKYEFLMQDFVKHKEIGKKVITEPKIYLLNSNDVSVESTKNVLDGFDVFKQE